MFVEGDEKLILFLYLWYLRNGCVAHWDEKELYFCPAIDEGSAIRGYLIWLSQCKQDLLFGGVARNNGQSCLIAHVRPRIGTIPRHRDRDRKTPSTHDTYHDPQIEMSFQNLLGHPE